jgi:hypothetical protein
MSEHIYIAQTAQGGDTGVDTANAHSVDWFHSAANWGVGAGKISAGDTVHLVGTISGINPQANGEVGNPITIYFEPNAKLSLSHSSCMYFVNRSNYVIDGGLNGVLENTDNGTELGHQAVVKCVDATGMSNTTFQNLTIRNIYVHSNNAAGLADSSLDFTTGGGIYANGYGAGVAIRNCTFSDMCWCIIMFGYNGGMLTVDGCTFTNYDHGIGGVACQNSGTVAGFVATNNRFGSTVNWDTTANTYHHDGIHTFWGVGSGGIPAAVISGNKFYGNWGSNNTAHVYCEQNYTTHALNESEDWIVANNVFIQDAGNYLNNGMLTGAGNRALLANNTFIGSSVSNSLACQWGGSNLTIRNNLVSKCNTQLRFGSVLSGGLSNNIYAEIIGNNNPFYSDATGNVASFSAWESAAGEVNSLNPSSIALNSDGSLLPGCAAIGAGYDLSTYFTTDFSGATRTLPWDIGAYEYTYAPSTPTGLQAVAIGATDVRLTWE